MSPHSLLLVCRTLLPFALLISACNLPPKSPPTPAQTSPPIPLPNMLSEVPATPQTVTPTVVQPAQPYFKAAVIVDTTSEPVSREQADALIQEASAIFSRLTPFGFQMVDYLEDGSGGTIDSLVSSYVQTHAASLPDGIMVLSFGDNDMAKLYGGYATQTPGPPGFRNTFVSPMFGRDKVYVAVIHYGHRFGACGYSGADTVQSTVSIDGECRNQPGTACVQHNGYSMCSTMVNDLYASTPTYFAASSMIHEFLHSFSAGGDQDHYATPECNAKMGYPQGFFDLLEADYYNGLCPFVYDNFVNSYQP